MCEERRIRPALGSAGSKQNGGKVKRFFLKLIVVATLVAGFGLSGSAQGIMPTPFFTSFADTLIASTYNGQLLTVGSIIQAYDPSGVYCGVDTVRLDTASGNAIFGYFPVYGDDPNTAGGIDEGAEAGEQITFRINGRTATVTAGDDTWADQTLKSVTLSASATIAIWQVSLPDDTLIMPGDTVTFQVEVRNDGNGLDYYGVKLSLSVPGSSDPYDWEAFEPADVVYADSGETVGVSFSVRAPTFNADTVNTVSYTVYSHLDTTATVTGTVDLTMTLTDVDGNPDIAMPGSFTLYQNYPNPFNPTTIIAFELSRSCAVRLDIIDILGRTVESCDL